MSLRMPQNLRTLSGPEAGMEAVNAEIKAEMASSLGRAGRAVEDSLARLKDPGLVASLGREVLLREAADAVWKFFIQREAMGLRDTSMAIRDFGIPRAVIVRLGAR